MKDRPIEIRYASHRDAELLAEIGATTFYDSYANDIAADDIADYLEASFGTEKQAAELADRSGCFLIAEVDGNTAGYARLLESEAPPDVTPQAIELQRIYVRQEYIGRGIGAALMRACLAEARQRGFEAIWLGVWERNPRAIGFYKKWGFEVAGVHAFQMGKETQTDVLLWRSAAPQE